MHLSALKRICPDLAPSNLHNVKDLINSLTDISDLFFGFIEGSGNDNVFRYLSPTVALITGYSAKRFLQPDGIKFFYSITDKSFLPHILEREAFYLKKIQRDDFVLNRPLLMEINAGMINSAGARLRIRYLGVILSYTDDRKMSLTFCTWQQLHRKRALENKLNYNHIVDVLTEIGEIFVKDLPTQFNTVNVSNSPIEIVYPMYEGPKVNKREMQVLTLIADGLSSKAIANHLNISFHTAEVHRRNLLLKFQAKNSAELIKKATKLYWFE